jgi:hypothetical protein
MGDIHPLLQFIGAKRRVGLEGFFCVFKSGPELAFKPVFWWTRPELEDFMALTVRNTRLLIFGTLSFKAGNSPKDN